jgi:hypothetical protein
MVATTVVSVKGRDASMRRFLSSTAMRAARYALRDA